MKTVTFYSPKTLRLFLANKHEKDLDLYYHSGANYYIQKPNNFLVLKNGIVQTINKIGTKNPKKTTRDTCILQP